MLRSFRMVRRRAQHLLSLKLDGLYQIYILKLGGELYYTTTKFLKCPSVVWPVL